MVDDEDRTNRRRQRNSDRTTEKITTMLSVDEMISVDFEFGVGLKNGIDEEEEEKVGSANGLG